MTRLVGVTALIAAIVGACGTSAPVEILADGDPAKLMAAALTHLVAEDHTFGQGPPPFREYLIEESTVDIEGANDSLRALNEPERGAVEDAISRFGPVRWIHDPDEWRTADLEPKIEGSVILGVGDPEIDDIGALVGVSLWCGGTCGTWLTYRLEEVDGEWQVTGIEGPISIS